MKAAEQPILLPLRAIPASLLSFEALLVFSVFTGVYKNDPRIAWVPVDLMGLLFALSVVVGAFIIVRNPIYRRSLPVVFAVMVLTVWLAVALAWSPSRVYGLDKLFRMATLGLWATMASAMIVAPSEERTQRFFTLLLVAAAWPAVETLMVYVKSGGLAGQIAVLGATGYLTIGRLSGLAALVALMAAVFGRRGPPRLLWLTVFAFFGFVVAITGGRGPLVASILPVFLLGVLGLRVTRTRIRYWPAYIMAPLLLLALSAAIVTYSEATQQRLASVSRLMPLLSGELGRSAGMRADDYGDSIQFAGQAPFFGHGTGSWPLLTGQPDWRSYPHNLFAELQVEGGLVAVALFLAVLGAAFRGGSQERLRRDPQALCATMLFFSAFLNAMVSGDLNDNRLMFMLIGVLALLAVRRQSTTAAVAAPADALAGDARSWPPRGLAPGGSRVVVDKS